MIDLASPNIDSPRNKATLPFQNGTFFTGVGWRRISGATVEAERTLLASKWGTSLRLASGATPTNLYEWWCERYASNTGTAYHSTAEARDTLLLRQTLEQSRLPRHQFLLAIDNWQRQSPSSVEVFCAHYVERLSELTESVDEIAVARIYLLSSRLTERQQAFIEPLRRTLDEYDDLSVAWDTSGADAEALLPPLRQLLDRMERAA